jgi:hypothetical protein
MPTNPNLNINDDNAVYNETFVGTFTSTALVTATGTVTATIKNGTVTLQLPAILSSAAGATPDAVIAMTGLPSAFWPSAEAYAFPAIISAAAPAVGRVAITAAGVVTFGADFIGAVFDDGATAKGIYKQTVQYAA